MKKAIILALAATVFLSSTVFAYPTFEDHVIKVYSAAKEIVEREFPGPIAAELTQVAVLRQGLEDGLDRKPDFSINGMGVGGRNKEVFDSISLPPDIKMSKIMAPDGMLSYQLKGPNSNLISILAIAKWLDKHICELPGISKSDKQMWNESKIMSYLLSTPFGADRHKEKLESCAEQRLKLIDKVNSMYGPGGGSLQQTRKKLQPVFQRAVE